MDSTNSTFGNMTRFSQKRPCAINVIVAAILTIFSLTRNAQATAFDYEKVPILKANPDFNGIDPASGTYLTASPFTVSAPGSGHLSYNTIFNGRRHSFSLNVYLEDNTFTGVYADPTIRHVRVHAGGVDKLFTCKNQANALEGVESPAYGVSCKQDVGNDGVQLHWDTDSYIYTDNIGARYYFFELRYQHLPPCSSTEYDDGCDFSQHHNYAYVHEIRYPSGEKLTYSPLYSLGEEDGQNYQSDTITSNLGYHSCLVSGKLDAISITYKGHLQRVQRGDLLGA